MSTRPKTAESKRYALDHEGRKRHYVLHVPAACPEPAPLVLVLHGSGGSGARMAQITHFNEVADRHGFVVVYPDGVQGHWNDGRPIMEQRPHLEGIDDAGFLLAVIDAVDARHAIDRARVYAAGASNGAMMCYRLAAEHADRFAAIAAVMSPMQDTLADIRPDVTMPVLLIHGTADPIVPFKGGDITLRNETFGRVLSVDDTVFHWVDHNACEPYPETDVVASCSEGMQVRRDRYVNHVAAVEVYTVEGGGHTWPGGLQYAPEFLIGKTCKAFDASTAIWEFFAEHRRTRTAGAAS